VPVMDDIYTRHRYTKHKFNNKRKRKFQKDNQPIMETIIKQTLIAILILALIGIIKNTDTKPTNYLSDKIKDNLSYNINPKKIYASFNNVINKLKWNPDENAEDNDAVPAGAGFNKKNEYTGSFIVPVNGYLSVGYGSYINQVTGESEFHKGIDIEVKGDGTVKAAHDGEIVEVGSEKDYGNYIKIKNGNITTVYANCTAISDEIGKSVKQGDVIAKVDGSDAGSGTHLHFEIWKDGNSVNPVDYIDIETE